MSKIRKVFLVVVAVVVLVVVSSIFLLDLLPSSRRPSLSFNWTKTGGIAGLSEQLTVLADGKAIWHDAKTGDDSSWRLTLAEHQDLYDLLSSLVANESSPGEFRPREDAADFFSYVLTMVLDEEESTLKWVDEWAAESELPASLIEILSLIEQMIDTSK